MQNSGHYWGIWEMTYHVLFTIHLPDAPFTFVLDYLLNHLLTGTSAFASTLLGGPRRHQDRPLAFGMGIDLLAWDHVPPLAPPHVFPPGDELLGVFEAAWAHAQPLQDRGVTIPLRVLAMGTSAMAVIP